MTQPAQHHTIHYVEFTTPDIAGTKAFYQKVFGWTFQDWGPDYISFGRENAGINGGFQKGETKASAGAPLVVLYSRDLKATEQAIVAAGGAIVVPTFEFPGGRRFHFSDGYGNVLAVWSE
ncbi:MAG: VOC family protein [Terriglobia bacterium]|nr:VOC family protein [Terriglobia bacterium]